MNKKYADGKSVLYVMSVNLHVSDSHTLLDAQKHALVKKLPITVVFCLDPATGINTSIYYKPLFTKLQKVESYLANLNIPLMIIIGNPKEKLDAVIHHTKPDKVYYGNSSLSGLNSLKQLVIHPYDWPGTVQDVATIQGAINKLSC